MTEVEFRALSAHGYNRIPLTIEAFADLDTPLSLYLKLANKPYTYLLESVVGGERFGRYSFIGLPARTLLRARGTKVDVETDGTVVETFEGHPLEFIAAFQKRDPHVTTVIGALRAADDEINVVRFGVSGKDYVAIEFGSGDNSFGAFFPATSDQPVSLIQDGSLDDCTVSL